MSPRTTHGVLAIVLAGVVFGPAACGREPPGAGASAPDREPASGPIEIAPGLEITRIAEGVWMHTTTREIAGGMLVPSNGLLLERPDGLLLIDTPWGEEPTRQLLTWIDSTLAAPVREAVVTHFHDDRTAGVPLLAEREIPYAAHVRTPELAGDLAAAPRQLVSDEPLHLDGAEVFFPGAGHTVDNLTVWLPAHRILFGGCAVRPGGAGGMGNTEDADLEAWPGSIRRLRERYGDRAARVVPSHGPPAGVSLLDHTLSLLEERRPGAP